MRSMKLIYSNLKLCCLTFLECFRSNVHVLLFFSTETALFFSFAKLNTLVFVLLIFDINIQKMLFFDFPILIFINILTPIEYITQKGCVICCYKTVYIEQSIFFTIYTCIKNNVAFIILLK